ncbi:hypothetical protein DFH06DRAFT_1298414 [Mycena polygramma]|nr:hypothetical protein DFH06DRAFT_1298414 [Mycena polygramma]
MQWEVQHEGPSRSIGASTPPRVTGCDKPPCLLPHTSSMTLVFPTPLHSPGLPVGVACVLVVLDAGTTTFPNPKLHGASLAEFPSLRPLVQVGSNGSTSLQDLRDKPLPVQKLSDLKCKMQFHPALHTQHRSDLRDELTRQLAPSYRIHHPHPFFTSRPIPNALPKRCASPYGVARALIRYITLRRRLLPSFFAPSALVPPASRNPDSCCRAQLDGAAEDATLGSIHRILCSTQSSFFFDPFQRDRLS